MKIRDNLPLTHERLLEVLYYDPETGIFTWKIDRRSKHKAGCQAGFNISSGQIGITIDYVRYLAHRLAWFYVHGKWPKEFLDHIDRNKKNNRIANLRECNHHQNMQNVMDASSRSKSGARGVCKPVDKKKWRATISLFLDGKSRPKYVGYFDTIEEAVEARRVAMIEHYGEFAPK